VQLTFSRDHDRAAHVNGVAKSVLVFVRQTGSDARARWRCWLFAIGLSFWVQYARHSARLGHGSEKSKDSVAGPNNDRGLPA